MEHLYNLSFFLFRSFASTGDTHNLSLSLSHYSTSLSPWQPIQASFPGPETRESSLVQQQWRHAPDRSVLTAPWHATLDPTLSCDVSLCVHLKTSASQSTIRRRKKLGFLTIMNLMSLCCVNHPRHFMYSSIITLLQCGYHKMYAATIFRIALTQ